MSAQPQNPTPPEDRSLSEISHLFLSSVRERQTNGAPRPQRTPPVKASPSQPPVDFGAESFAHGFPSSPQNSPPTDSDELPRALADHLDPRVPVSAVVAAHLNGHQRDRVREYAAHLCKTGERIGLIEIDAADFRLTCFELGSPVALQEIATCDQLDARKISEALEEMTWDIDRWLLLVPNPRLPEARALLRKIDRWTVLATCDHDGVVACYRSLKGLSDVHRHDQVVAGAQVLSLALLDADDEMESMRVFAKLAGACRQFLHWPLEYEPAVVAAGSVVEHDVLICHARDKTVAAHWQIIGDFLSRSKSSVEPAKPVPSPVQSQGIKGEVNEQKSEPRVAAPTPAAGIVISADEVTMPRVTTADVSAFNEVIDLPAGADSAAAIVSAAVRGDSGLVECPLKPPMLADASLAVARDRRLILVAVAKQGLSDLRSIGEAWRWMNENRPLIAMAVPQLSIDPHQLPHLRLLIDRADISAETLQPLLQTGNVTVHTYRKLRWGEKTGLLLEAA